MVDVNLILLHVYMVRVDEWSDGQDEWKKQSELHSLC